jgi:dual specificity phosphatase 12
MMSETLSSTDAQQAVRMAREQSWIRQGFVEQLVLFELCHYAPGDNNLYLQWRDRRRLADQEAGIAK